MAETRRTYNGTPAPPIDDLHPLSVPARIIWKNSCGAIRFAAVTTRDVGDAGAVVELDVPASIPLHRLVYLQVEKSAQSTAGLPACLRRERVLSVVWGMDPCRRATGTPSGYSLRFLNEPRAVTIVLPAAEGVSQIAAAG